MAKFIWGPRSALGLLIAFVVFAADQSNKLYMLNVYYPKIGGCDPFTEAGRRLCQSEWAPFLDVVMVWNRGISYGLFQQTSATGMAILVGLSLCGVILLIVWLARNHGILAAVSLGLIIGGALGNLIDRVAYGAVADFFLLHAAGYQWYVFNIADAAIVFGIIGLFYDALFPR